eukprot:scaffold43813_cov55-Phaeocystis_antarctica.AAC.6
MLVGSFRQPPCSLAPSSPCMSAAVPPCNSTWAIPARLGNALSRRTSPPWWLGTSRTCRLPGAPD